MFDLGSVYPAAITVAGADGLATNADTVVLTITLPDQTTATPTIVNPPAAVGAYNLPYLTVQSGRHTVRWLTTNPNTSFTDVFDVAEAVPPSIISLASIKRELGIDQADTADDDELREKLAGITSSIERYLHEIVVARSFTERTVVNPPFTRRTLRLMQLPVIRVASVVSEDGLTTWDLNNLAPDPNTGLVHVKAGPSILGTVLTTYTAGYTAVPGNIRNGAMVLFEHVWEGRRGPGGLTGVVGPEELASLRQFTAMPRKVTEWLGQPRPVVM